MKFRRLVVFGCFISVSLIGTVESTFVAGTALYLFGNILARQMVQYVHKLAIQGIDSQNPSKIGLASMTSNVLQNVDFTPVMKYMWPELFENNNGTQNNSTNANRRDSPSSDSDEVNSEEVKDYLLDRNENVENMAHEELVKEDPEFFYFVMKDRHKNAKKNETRRNDKLMEQNPLQTMDDLQPPIGGSPPHFPPRNPFFRMPRLRRFYTRSRQQRRLPIFIRSRPFGRIHYDNAMIPKTSMQRPILHFNF